MSTDETQLAGLSDAELEAELAARREAAAIAQAPAAAGPADEPVVQPVTIDDVAAENARLRSELLAENEKLRAALAESRESGLSFVGLTDEDVRRLEHPDEFTVSNDELHSRLAAVEAQLKAAGVEPAA